MYIDVTLIVYCHETFVTTKLFLFTSRCLAVQHSGSRCGGWGGIREGKTLDSSFGKWLMLPKHIVTMNS